MKKMINEKFQLKTAKRRVVALTMALLVLLSGCLSGCGNTGEKRNSAGGVVSEISEENKLVIYTAHKEEIYKPIIREFERRTGIWVEVVSGGTSEMLEMIKNEREESPENSKADIMFGGGVDSLMLYEDCFEPYVTTQADKLDDTYASEGNYYTVFSKLPVVFIYNTKFLLRSGAPMNWEQFIDSGFSNDIAFADPQKSGSSLTILSFLVQHLEKKGISTEDVIKGFCRNLNGSLSKGSDTVFTDVNKGDKAVGITLEETALKNIKENSDVEIVYPKDGTCALPDGCAIVKGANHRENAEKFMEFVVCDDVQHLLEDELCRRSVRKDFESNLISGEEKYDLKYFQENKEKLIELWRENL